MESIKGTGMFQWDKWGWFGSQLGMTAWMIVAPIVCIEGAFRPRLWLVVCFVLLNGIGWGLWRNRYRIAPYWGFQALLLAGLIMTMLAFLGIHWVGGGPKVFDPRLDRMKALYACLLIFPGMMLWGHILNQQKQSDE